MAHINHFVPQFLLGRSRQAALAGLPGSLGTQRIRRRTEAERGARPARRFARGAVPSRPGGGFTRRVPGREPAGRRFLGWPDKAAPRARLALPFPGRGSVVGAAGQRPGNTADPPPGASDEPRVRALFLCLPWRQASVCDLGFVGSRCRGGRERVLVLPCGAQARANCPAPGKYLQQVGPDPLASRQTQVHLNRGRHIASSSAVMLSLWRKLPLYGRVPARRCVGSASAVWPARSCQSLLSRMIRVASVVGHSAHPTLLSVLASNGPPAPRNASLSNGRYARRFEVGVSDTVSQAQQLARTARHSTAERIVSAACKLWADRGFHGASIDEIGKAAGVTGPAIYSHFHSKHEILTSAMSDHWETMRVALERAVDNDLKTLESLMEYHIDSCIAKTALLSIWARERRHLPEPERSQVLSRQRLYVHRYIDLLSVLRPGIPASELQTTVEAGIAIMALPLNFPPRLPPEQLRTFLKALVMRLWFGSDPAEIGSSLVTE
jgi:AcrR family transcriptional regulator